MSDARSGACRCGQVRLAVRGAPMLTMACHCTGCQRMTASAFSLSSLYPQDAVTIDGALQRGGLMTDPLQHMFCPACLSWVLTRADFLGPLINIRSTMMTDDAKAPPFIECWLDEKLPWVSIGAAHGFAGFPPEERFPLLIAEFMQRKGQSRS